MGNKNNLDLTDYAELPIEVRKTLASTDPAIAREMAARDLLVLSSRIGYEILSQHVEKLYGDLTKMSREIGASSAADADHRENSEFMDLKVYLPIHAEDYARQLQQLQNTLIYSEEVPGQVCFGHLFRATVKYPDRIELSTRNYALLGPNEVSHGNRYYTDEEGGEKFVVVSYASQLGQAVWGADIESASSTPLTFSVPNMTVPAQIVSIELLGRAA